MINIKDIHYNKIIGLGFQRQDINDPVLFNKTGYSGYNLYIEFPSMKLGITTPCKLQGEGKWDFSLYHTESGNIIRKVKLIELKSLVEYFTIRDKEINKVLSNSDKVINKQFDFSSAC